MIPTFNFDDPPSSGVIGSKAADLFMQQGQAIAKTIEKRALTAEAQAKAPALATVYADGLSRLSQGDMSGMELLARARAESVGNPFLTAMTEDATKEGARMAAMHIEQTLAGQRIQADKDRTNLIDQRSQQARDDALWAQTQNDYRDTTARVQEERNKLSNEWQTNQDAENQIAERENRKPKQIPKPILPDLPPPPARPVRRGSSANNTATGYPALPVSDPLVNESLPPVGPSAVSPESKPVATFVPGQGVEEDTGPTDISQAVVPESAPAPRNIETPGKRAGMKTIDVDGIVFEYPEPRQGGTKASRTDNIKTRTGSVTFTDKDIQEDPSKVLEESLATIKADTNFASWSRGQIQDDSHVVVRPEPGPNGKGVVYQPYSYDPVTKVETPMGKVGPDGKPTGEKQQVTEETYKAWLASQKVMNGPLQGKVNVHMKLGEKMKTRLRSQMIKEVAAGRATIEETEKNVRFYRLDPITQKDIEKATTPEVKSEQEVKSEIAELKEAGIEINIPKDGRGISIRYPKDLSKVTPQLRKKAEAIMAQVTAKYKAGIDKEKEEKKKKKGYMAGLDEASSSDVFPWLED